MLLDHLIEGGIYFMLPIYVMWIMVFAMAISFLAIHAGKNRNLFKLKTLNSLIIFTGSFAFLLGLLGQTIGIYQAMDVIQQIGDVSPALIAGGIKVSLLAPLYGFVLFLVSGIIWFVFRNMLRAEKT